MCLLISKLIKFNANLSVTTPTHEHNRDLENIKMYYIFDIVRNENGIGVPFRSKFWWSYTTIDDEKLKVHRASRVCQNRAMKPHTIFILCLQEYYYDL